MARYGHMTHAEEMEMLGDIIEVFEIFLVERGIVVKNYEKDEAQAQGETPSNIYGSDYGDIYYGVREVLASWDIVGMEEPL